MPHLVLEYSANLPPRLDAQRLVDRLHAAALETGAFEVGALRTRAAARACYRIADGHPDNAFVAAVLRVGHGRDADTRRRIGEAIFAAMCEELTPLLETLPLGVSFEVQEIDPNVSFKKNTLHDFVDRRQRRETEPHE